MFSTPILFLIFNRPETTALVFEQIKRVQPEFFFVAADGPRRKNIGEEDQCRRARDIVVNGIDWKCQLKIFFRDENVGCKKAVSGAINWFFENVEEGIIIEDDCLPDPSFFQFASLMLEKYRFDKSIVAINGCNYGFNHVKSSYFFSRYMNAWGWATWRREAQQIDYEIQDWGKQNKISFLRSRLKKHIIDLDQSWFQQWKIIFDLITSGELNTWDYYWVYYQFLYQKKNIVASKNLIRNIGFSADATHTTLLTHPASDLQINKLIFPLVNPRNNRINKDFEEEALKPVCFLYKRKSNFFYIKNKIFTIPIIKFILQPFRKKGKQSPKILPNGYK